MDTLQNTGFTSVHYRGLRTALWLAVGVFWLLPTFILRAQFTYTTNGNAAFYADSNLISVTFEGDQPSGATNLFSGASPTLYHLPGTIGWRETYGGRPTLLWNPSTSLSDLGFGVKGGAFGFRITGTPGITVVVEASPNPATGPWVPVGTNTLADGSSIFTDQMVPHRCGTFYRFHTP